MCLECSFTLCRPLTGSALRANHLKTTNGARDGTPLGRAEPAVSRGAGPGISRGLSWRLTSEYDTATHRRVIELDQPAAVEEIRRLVRRSATPAGIPLWPRRKQAR